MTSYAIQAGALRENPKSGPDGVVVQADIAYTLEARAEVQAVCGVYTGDRPQASNDNTSKLPLRFLSVCSGIEAASVAWHPLGWRAVAFSEIEKFPSAVLAHHYPDVPNLGDFTNIDTTKLGQVDVLAGGTPCQAFSVAGLRQGLEDARGNLTLKFVELAHELAGHGKTDGNGLRNVVWENVVGVLSDKGNAFGCFLAGLVGADAAIVPPGGKWSRHGMVSGPKGRAAWAVKDAQFFGVPQRRRRVLVVADFGNGADPAAVLFEPEGVFRNPPARGEAGKGVAADVAPSLVSSGRGVERTGDTRGQDPVLACTKEWPAEVASTLDTTFGPKMGLDDQHINGGATWFVPQAVGVHGDIAHTLKAGGADASEDGTGRGTPVIAFTAKDYGADAAEELSPTLRAGGFTGSHANGGVMPAVAFAENSRAELRLEGGDGQTVGCIGAGRGKPGQGYPAVLTSAVRRLTPMECERLQGFTDGYTRIPMRAYDKRTITKNRPEDMWECIDGQWWLMSADGPRYKALGNSWAVPKFVWLGKRIAQFMPPAADNDNDGVRDAA